jgi:hypothetical protein
LNGLNPDKKRSRVAPKQDQHQYLQGLGTKRIERRKEEMEVRRHMK